MFSVNRTVVAVAVTVFSLALLAGCKTSRTKPQPKPVMPPPPVVTNRPVTPPVAAQPDSGDSMAPNILTWDATSKEYNVKPGDVSAPFTFSFTNVSHGPVVIYDTETSCDCTVATLPSKPWTIPSGGDGQIGATINLSNKVRTVTNYVIVFTSQGNRKLNVKAVLPGPSVQ